jgi:hypothetical protein
MKKSFSLLLTSLLFFNCTSDSTDDLTTSTPTTITYTANVRSIINQSCATSGCHNAAGNSGNLILENFTQVKNAFLNRNALGRMESATNPMPASGNLPNTSIEIMKKWKDQGYLE